MQFAFWKHSLDEEFNFFNREYAIHIFYIVLSLCECCIFQELSLFYQTYEIDWCKIIFNSPLTFYFSFNPIVYLVIWLLSLLVLRFVSLLYFVIRVLFFFFFFFFEQRLYHFIAASRDFHLISVVQKSPRNSFTWDHKGYVFFFFFPQFIILVSSLNHYKASF